MMKSLLLLSSLIFTVVSSLIVPRKVNYDGYKVVRLSTGSSLPKVKSLIKDLSLSTWNGGPKANAEVDIVVPSDKVAEFDASTADLAKTVMHENLGAAIAEESDGSDYRGMLLVVQGWFKISVLTKGSVGSANASWFNTYHAYSQHLQFLNDLAATYPSNAEVVTIGNSLQGRPITGIHFYGTGLKGQRPAVVLHGTVHAREWITTMVCLFFLRLFLVVKD